MPNNAKALEVAKDLARSSDGPRRHTPNHTIDPETGFLESNGYAVMSFDAERKIQFLRLYQANGLRFRKTCKDLGLSHNTVLHHYKIDDEFKKALDELQADYAEDLESSSMQFAMLPKHFMDRCMQLRRLYPEKYDSAKSSGSPQIIINLDGKFLDLMQKREQIIEAKIVESVRSDEQAQIGQSASEK